MNNNLFTLLTGQFARNILKLFLSLFIVLLLIDLIRFYNFLDEARQESQNIANYIMPYAESMAESATGLAAPPEEVRPRVTEAFERYVLEIFPSSKYSVAKTYSDSDFTVFTITPAPGIGTKRGRDAFGEIKVQMMFKVTDPYLGKYKIGAGYMRKQVSILGFHPMRDDKSLLSFPVTSVRIQELQQGYAIN